MKLTIEAILGDKHSNLWGFHFLIPEAIAAEFKEGKTTRIVATFNDAIKHHCAIMPSAEGPFIMLNKELVKKLNAEPGDLITIHLEKDNSEYGMPICEEFEAVIFGDEAVFDYLQRNLIHLVNKIKSSDIKINRSMAIAEHLIEARGVIDFKELNEKIKEFNQRNRIQ